MFNVQISLKIFNFFLLLLVPTLILPACSGSLFSGKSETEEKCEQLTAQIDSAINCGQYFEAIALIDSLNSSYPEEIHFRKGTLLSRARAMEGIIRDSIPLVEAEIARSQIAVDSLKNFFTAGNQQGVTAFAVDKSVKNISLASGNVLQPRLGDSLESWSISVGVRSTKPIKAVTLLCNGETLHIASSEINESVVQGQGYEMFSLNSTESGKIADFLRNSGEEGAKLMVMFERGDIGINISEAMKMAICRTSEFALEREKNRHAKVERELLERKLIVAQNQIANFSN